MQSTRNYPENFAREPVPKVRIQLRTELRKRGVQGKFGTDVMRDGCIRVKGTVSDTSLSEFKGRKICYLLKSQKANHV